MLKELLSNKKSIIIEKWIRSVADSYPVETSKFLRQQKNRFSNPVGYSISSSAENLFDGLLSGNDLENVKEALSGIIKIRAVQEFSPSQAVGFIFLLKKIIRDELSREINTENYINELLEIETAIDGMALTAFDLYMDSREKLFQIRVKEFKARLLFNEMNGAVE